jgi:hypothetical protein
LDGGVTAAFDRILNQCPAIGILVSNVWGGYEGMVENGQFTWPLPFWPAPVAHMINEFHSFAGLATTVFFRPHGDHVNADDVRVHGRPSEWLGRSESA